MRPTMESVSSSNVDEIGYDEDNQELWVQFKGGGDAYVYYPVPQGVFNSFQSANSKGSFLHQNIKDHYSFKRG